MSWINHSEPVTYTAPDAFVCILFVFFRYRTQKSKKIVHLHPWVSLLRPAPFELPQSGNTARVKGCSGAIKGACPFFSIFQKNPIFLNYFHQYSRFFVI